MKGHGLAGKFFAQAFNVSGDRRSGRSAINFLEFCKAELRHFPIDDWAINICGLRVGHHRLADGFLYERHHSGDVVLQQIVWGCAPFRGKLAGFSRSVGCSSFEPLRTSAKRLASILIHVSSMGWSRLSGLLGLYFRKTAIFRRARSLLNAA